MRLEGDQQVVVQILRRALEEPTRQLVDNAGLEGSVVVQELLGRQKKDPNVGFDVMAEEYRDLVKAGIIDPAKVTRSALENAASVAAIMLTTDALVTEKPEKEKTPMPGGGMPDYD